MKPLRAPLILLGCFWLLLSASLSSCTFDARRGEADRIAKESNVKLYRFVNVGNHVHIVFKAHSRPDFQRFLRVFGGSIAMLVTGARKGKPVAKSGTKFWDFSVHTKIVSFGKQWTRLSKYMEKNLYEAEGAGVLLRMPDFDIYAEGLGY